MAPGPAQVEGKIIKRCQSRLRTGRFVLSGPFFFERHISWVQENAVSKLQRGQPWMTMSGFVYRAEPKMESAISSNHPVTSILSRALRQDRLPLRRNRAARGRSMRSLAGQPGRDHQTRWHIQLLRDCW